jgi:4-amino-4-deoxy-L-arabinose transferase-like glycosyltransferase
MTKKLHYATWGLIVFQVIFWTFVPLFAHNAPPLDVSEMHGWAQTFQWGFYKHPPMPTWIIAASQFLVGKNMLSLFLPASLSIAGTYYCVGWLAGKFLPEKEAIVALFLYSLTIFCNLWSTDFNHNQIQMPFWAMSIVFIYLTLTTGESVFAILLGVAMGLNALSKYTAALLVPCVILLMIFSYEWRKKISFKLFFFSAIAFFLTFGGHLQWLLHNNFLPLRYVSDRFEEIHGQQSNLRALLDYLGNIFGAHLLLLLMCIFLIVKYKNSPKENFGLHSNKNLKFLWFIGAGPVLFSCLIGLAVPLYSRWSTPMLPMITVIVGVYLLGRFKYLYTKRVFILYLVIQCILGLAYINKDKMNKERSSRAIYPAPELAAEVYRQWHEKYPNNEFKIVAGGEWETGFVSLFSPIKTYVYTEANSDLAPWVTEKMANDCGLVMIAPSPQEIAKFPRVQMQPDIIIEKNALHSQGVLHWGLLAPLGDCSLK